MGCPTSYDGMSATWSKGKLSRLSSGTLASGTTNYTYSYNGFGQRVSKTYSFLEGTNGLNPVQTGQVINYSKQYYYDHAGRLIAETINKSYYNASATVEHIVYLYDENSIVGIDYTSNGATYRYFFQRNLQGDVTAIFNTSGTIMAKYLYDAWGNCTISSETTNFALANANPIRYRGYYYDDDTGLYYCNARYYSPKWRRFISPDDTSYLDPESINGLNLYCYCGNDPVNLADPSGHFVLSTFLICLGVGVAIGGALGGYTAYTNDQDVLTGIFTGALLGAAVGAVVGIGGAALSGAMSSVLSKTTTDLMSVLFYGGEFGTWEDYAIAFAFGGLGGSLGSVTGRLSGVAKGAKFVSDVAIRPLTNQLIKSGTRGRSFNAEKYLYDVVTCALTNGGSHSIMRGNIFGMNLKVDFGKSFYRATFRSLYSYI